MFKHDYVTVREEDIYHKRFFRIFERLSTNVDVLKHFLRIASFSSKVQLNDCNSLNSCSSILCSRHGRSSDEKKYHIQGPDLFKIDDFFFESFVTTKSSLK